MKRGESPVLKVDMRVKRAILPWGFQQADFSI